jgi:hypothetical protein
MAHNPALNLCDERNKWPLALSQSVNQVGLARASERLLVYLTNSRVVIRCLCANHSKFSSKNIVKLAAYE